MLRGEMRSAALATMVGVIVACATTAAPAYAADAAAGATLAAKQCAQCHGQDGAGNGPTLQELNAPVKPIPWSNKTAMAVYTDAQITQIITEGGKSLGKSPLMPSFKGKLSSGQIADLAAYVESLGK